MHPETRKVIDTAVIALSDKKGVDLALLDVSELLVITDVFVIATGTSRRHVLTLAAEVDDYLAAEDREPLRREGMDDGTWVLLDYGDVVVHVFDERTRAFYDLEHLWGDAPRLPLAATA